METLCTCPKTEKHMTKLIIRGGVNNSSSERIAPFQPPKQTFSAKEFAFHSPQQRMDRHHVPSAHYATSSTVFQRTLLPHCSQRLSVPSQEIILSTQSEMLSSTQFSTRPASLATPFEEELQSPPSQQ